MHTYTYKLDVECRKLSVIPFNVMNILFSFTIHSPNEFHDQTSWVYAMTCHEAADCR